MSTSSKLLFGVFVGHDDSCADDKLIDKLSPGNHWGLEELLETYAELKEEIGCCFDCCARYVAVKALTIDTDMCEGIEIDPLSLHSRVTPEHRKLITDFFAAHGIEVQPKWYAVALND